MTKNAWFIFSSRDAVLPVLRRNDTPRRDRHRTLSLLLLELRAIAMRVVPESWGAGENGGSRHRFHLLTKDPLMRACNRSPQIGSSLWLKTVLDPAGISKFLEIAQLLREPCITDGVASAFAHKGRVASVTLVEEGPHRAGEVATLLAGTGIDGVAGRLIEAYMDFARTARSRSTWCSSICMDAAIPG